MTDLEASAPAPRLNTKVIDALEVAVEAYLGGARMTVAALTALGPGGVVALDTPLNGEVELRVGGATIARGELVAVGDAFAVRIGDVAA